MLISFKLLFIFILIKKKPFQLAATYSYTTVCFACSIRCLLVMQAFGSDKANDFFFFLYLWVLSDRLLMQHWYFGALFSKLNLNCNFPSSFCYPNNWVKNKKKKTVKRENALRVWQYSIQFTFIDLIFFVKNYFDPVD